MGNDWALLIIPLVIVMAVGFRLIAGVWNHARIRDYIEGLGGTVQQIEWVPFGPGWFGDKQPIYHVLYKDAGGDAHDAYCKTSMLAGVYFTRDEIVRKAANRPESLEEENRRLRAEIERMKREG